MHSNTLSGCQIPPSKSLLSRRTSCSPGRYRRASIICHHTTFSLGCGSWEMISKLKVSVRLHSTPWPNVDASPSISLPPPLLVQVWDDTPKGSSIRKLLLGWAAEYIRSSQTPNDFADTLPKEILSELVVAMRSDASPPAPAATSASVSGGPSLSTHYPDDEDAQDGHARKRPRYSDVLPNGFGASATGNAGRKSLPFEAQHRPHADAQRRKAPFGSIGAGPKV